MRFFSPRAFSGTTVVITRCGRAGAGSRLLHDASASAHATIAVAVRIGKGFYATKIVSCGAERSSGGRPAV